MCIGRRRRRRAALRFPDEDDIIFFHRDDYTDAQAAPLPASLPAVTDTGQARGSLEKVSDVSETGSLASGRFKLSGVAAATYRFETQSGIAINSDAPFIISFVYKHTSGNFEIGLYNNSTASGNPTAGIIPTTTKLQIRIGADVIEAYDLTADADYRITIEYDGTTTKWSIKGGSEYTAWTEIYKTRLITWGANSYWLVKNTNAVVEFDEMRIQNRYIYDTAITIYPTFRVETSGADTFDPVITTSSGTATWQYGDGSADEVTNSVSHAIAGAQKMLVRLTNLAPAKILTLDSINDKLSGDIWSLGIDVMSALTNLFLSNNNLDGDLSSWRILPSLTQLWLQNNNFDGNLSLWILPASLTQLFMHDNNFTGDLSLWILPPALSELWIYINNFDGNLSSWVLPTGLSQLFMESNNFSGDLSSWVLPSGLTGLLLAENNFSGDLSSWVLPSSLINIWLYDNNFLNVPTDYSPCLVIEEIQLQDNALSQSEVDAVVADLYANRALFTDTTPTLDISGTNSTPSGIYQDGDPPTTGKEYIFELENDPEVEGFNQWVITYTP